MRYLGAFLLWIHLITAATVVPAPIDVGPSQFWDGDDGAWSTFPIRVGTPAQNVRVLISTAATNTWVVADPEGCEGFALPNCADTRGALFNPNKSSTWVDNGPFGLLVEQNLGYDDSGEFGFDTVGLGWQGSGGPTLNHTVLAEISSPNYILGRFGLNPRPTNFSTFNDPQTSYLSLLYEQNEIPSLSYSYSAGAKYRNNGVLGSLTLGGYSEGLFEPNDISFPFYFDQERDLTVGIQGITSQVGTANTSLLPSGGILSFIDSTVTQIWLPEDACQVFETTFGLTYDNNTDLYMLNQTQHTKLVTQNPNITFTLGLTKQGGQTIDITFPYAAFDLNISYPTVENSTWYFPLRRAVNDTQYTLGRAFLQEAYLTVDYERNNFSVSQRNWDSTAQSHIVAITPPNSTTSSIPGSSGTSPASKNATKKSGIGTGAIVGIIVVAVALIAAGIGLFFFFRIRKRKAAEQEAMLATAAAMAANDENKDNDTMSPQSIGVTELYSPPKHPPELSGNYFEGHEADGGDVQLRTELDAQARQAELEGEVIRYELEAPHGMHEMSNMRATRDHPRWGETTSPLTSPISRKSVPSPQSAPSPQSPP